MNLINTLTLHKGKYKNIFTPSGCRPFLCRIFSGSAL